MRPKATIIGAYEAVSYRSSMRTYRVGAAKSTLTSEAPHIYIYMYIIYIHI
jgi:hypothetical protein